MLLPIRNQALNLLNFSLLERFFYLKKRKVKVGYAARTINLKALDIISSSSPRLFLNPFDEGFSKEFFLYGFREPLNTLMTYLIIKKKKPIVIDVGANIGYFTLIALLAGAKHVVSLEPNPITFSYLIKNVNAFANVTVLNLALNNESRKAKFVIARHFNLSSLSDSRMYNTIPILKELDVECVSLSDVLAYVQEGSDILLRMDIEGGEYKVLSGKIPDPIKIIILELHVYPPFSKSHAVHLIKHLWSEGFTNITYTRDFPLGWNPIIARIKIRKALKLAR